MLAAEDEWEKGPATYSLPGMGMVESLMWAIMRILWKA